MMSSLNISDHFVTHVQGSDDYQGDGLGPGHWHLGLLGPALRQGSGLRKVTGEN